MVTDNHSRPTLFFDGFCNLCNRAVQFIIRHDKKKIFLFAPLQSAAGQTALVAVSTSSSKKQNGHGSVVFFCNGRYFIKSGAALHTFRLLGGPWRLLYTFIIIPPFLRDAVYDLIARNRYKWFGKRQECMLPTPELTDRFLN